MALRLLNHLALIGLLAGDLALAQAETVQPAEPAKPTVESQPFVPEEFAGKRRIELEEALRQARALAQEPAMRIDLDEALETLRYTPGKPLDSARAADALSLSLSEARARALQNNLALQVARLDPVIAQTTVDEERAKFDNIIFANARYRSKDTPLIGDDIVKFSSADPALDDATVKLSKSPQETRQLEGEVGLDIPLRTGATVRISSPLESKETLGPLGSEEYRSALRFSITQPLLRNAGRTANEASIRIAEYGAQTADLQQRLQAIRVLAMIDKAYWELYSVWAELDVRRQQHALASQNLTMVKRRVEEGLTAAVEVNRAEIGVADRVEALIIASTNLKLKQRRLKFLLNAPELPITAQQLLVPISEPTLIYYDFDRERIVEQALAGRIELLELELKLASDLINIDYRENQTLPLFTLDYGYGALSGTGSGFGDSYGKISDRYDDWYVGLRFEMPVTNEARKQQLQRAVQQRLQRLTTKTLQQQTVRAEILDTLDQVEQHWQRILATRQQVIISGMNYEAELKQFNAGLRTMTEVLEMLSRLGEAQIKEIRAVQDYQIALVDLAYSTGTVLGYSQVDF